MHRGWLRKGNTHIEVAIKETKGLSYYIALLLLLFHVFAIQL